MGRKAEIFFPGRPSIVAGVAMVLSGIAVMVAEVQRQKLDQHCHAFSSFKPGFCAIPIILCGLFSVVTGFSRRKPLVLVHGCLGFLSAILGMIILVFFAQDIFTKIMSTSTSHSSNLQHSFLQYNDRAVENQLHQDTVTSQNKSSILLPLSRSAIQHELSMSQRKTDTVVDQGDRSPLNYNWRRILQTLASNSSQVEFLKEAIMSGKRFGSKVDLNPAGGKISMTMIGENADVTTPDSNTEFESGFGEIYDDEEEATEMQNENDYDYFKDERVPDKINYYFVEDKLVNEALSGERKKRSLETEFALKVNLQVCAVQLWLGCLMALGGMIVLILSIITVTLAFVPFCCPPKDERDLERTAIANDADALPSNEDASLLQV